MQRAFTLVVAIAALFLLGATGKSDLKITDAWVRPTPPGAPTAAVYALIENASAEPDRLLGVESDAAEAAELHTMSMEGGMMIMKPVEGGLVVPAHGALQFKPGGYHIMLIHPRHTIQPGQQVQVTLVFQQAGRVTLSVPAKQPGAAGSMGHGQGMGGQGMGGPAMGQHDMAPGSGAGMGQGHGGSK